MSYYGGSAALVVNKQETDRERRLRLRREEFQSRNGAAPPPEEPYAAGRAVDRIVYSRGPAQADDGGHGRQRPAGGDQSEGRGVGEGSYLSQPLQHPAAGGNEPASRESIWEAKRRRYLELRGKLQPAEQEALDSQYKVVVKELAGGGGRGGDGADRYAPSSDVPGEGDAHPPRTDQQYDDAGGRQQQQHFKAAPPPVRAGRNDERAGELDQLDSLYDAKNRARAGMAGQRDPAWEQGRQDQAPPPPREYPQQLEYSPPQRLQQAPQHNDSHEHNYPLLNHRYPPAPPLDNRQPLRQVQAGGDLGHMGHARARAGGGSAPHGVGINGLFFGGGLTRKEEEEQVLKSP